MNAKIRLAALVAILSSQTITALAGDGEWFLMSRENGCFGIEVLAKREDLPSVPKSPEEFADMMRAKGYAVTIKPISAELSGKAVEVKVKDNLSPVFVTKEICEGAENRKR